MRSALRALEHGGSPEQSNSGLSGDHPIPKESLAGSDDAEEYAQALSRIGPCGYGGIAYHLGWGASRASAAETILRRAGRLAYDSTDRARLSEP